MKDIKFNFTQNQKEYMVYYILINDLNPDFINKVCEENNMTISQLIDYLEEKLEINK